MPVPIPPRYEKPSPYFWTDKIQEQGHLGGFHSFGLQYNQIHVEGDDTNGANLTIVKDPAGGPGYALRHFARFDLGARAQAGLFSFVTPEFAEVAASEDGLYLATEMFFPEMPVHESNPGNWISMWDWHSVGPHGQNRWHTAPGIFIDNWGGKLYFGAGHFFTSNNQDNGLSWGHIPIGEWFDLEMHFKWTTEPFTMRFWLNGVQVHQNQLGATRAPDHVVLEMYSKWYGWGTWKPIPTIRYTRNVRMSRRRIWQESKPEIKPRRPGK